MNVTLPATQNLSLKVEDAATAYPSEKMTDTGDRRTFASTGTRFSLCANDENDIDRRPVVLPDGVRNGCMVIPSSNGASDAIEVYPGTVWIGGTLINVAQTLAVALTRPSAAQKKIDAVIVTSGGTVQVVAGTEGDAFSDQRGSAGGPPLVPVGEVELATVEIGSATSAPFANHEVIYAPELCHAPSYRLSPYDAKVVFARALPAVHVGATPKDVWISWHGPQMIPLDVIAVTPPVADVAYDPLAAKTMEATGHSGTATLILSGDQSDLARRIDGSVRLMEIAPDTAHSRREMIYALIELSAQYRPGGLMTGTATLTPVQQPSIETV